MAPAQAAAFPETTQGLDLAQGLYFFFLVALATVVFRKFPSITNNLIVTPFFKCMRM